MQINKWVYCHNTTGSNAIAIQIGNLTLYFSYETIVAFADNINGLVVSENIWSVTTGKHLNAISSDRKLRVPHTEFIQKLEATLKQYGLEA